MVENVTYLSVTTVLNSNQMDTSLSAVTLNGTTWEKNIYTSQLSRSLSTQLCETDDWVHSAVWSRGVLHALAFHFSTRSALFAQQNEMGQAHTASHVLLWGPRSASVWRNLFTENDGWTSWHCQPFSIFFSNWTFPKRKARRAYTFCFSQLPCTEKKKRLFEESESRSACSKLSDFYGRPLVLHLIMFIQVWLFSLNPDFNLRIPTCSLHWN